MPRFLLSVSPLGGILLFAAFLIGTVWIEAPSAFAQRVGAPGRVPAPHVIPPPMAHPAIPHPALVPVRPLTGFQGPNIGFDGHPIYVFRPPFFGPQRFFFAPNLWFAPVSWVTCGPFWGWQFGCNGWPLATYNFETYVVPPPVYQPPVYVYVSGGRKNDLVELFLKDGTVIGVTDYWFVDNEVHFTVAEEGNAKPAEQVIALEDLDLQHTIDVNTRRGFRFVMRNEPWQQFMRDHPDVIPPTVPPPTKN